jgi:hypothetical protein
MIQLTATKRIVFSLIPLLICLLLAEAWARWRYAARAQDLEALERGRRPPSDGDLSLIDMIRPSDDPDRVFEPIPHVSGTYLGHPYRTNAFGMRDDETTVEKPPGIFRVAAVGDSFQWGWRVPAEATYPSLLESYLNETLAAAEVTPGTAPLRYEVLNFSVPGYNTVMEAALFRAEVERFDPDLVVLGFCINDLALPNFVRRRPSLWTLRRLFLPDYVRRLRRPPAAGEAPLLIPAHAVADGRIQTDFDPDPAGVEPEFRRLVGFDNYVRALETFSRWSRRTGRPVLCVFFREFARDFEPWHQPEASQAEAERLTRIQAAAREAGLLIVDSLAEQLALLDRHPEATARVFWSRMTDAHPSLVGQAVLFQSLYRRLVEGNLLPDGASRLAGLAEAMAEWDRRIDRLYARTIRDSPWGVRSVPAPGGPPDGPDEAVSSDGRHR